MRRLGREEYETHVESCGIRLAIKDYGGHGRPLVFIHGGPGQNLMPWEPFARRLADRFRCVTFDLRGHGQSSDADDFSFSALAADVGAVVNALALSNVVVVGHSWGGMIGLVYAATHLGCAGLVAVDGITTDRDLTASREELEWLERELRADPLLGRASEFVGTPNEVDDLLEWATSIAPDRYSLATRQQLRRDFVEGPAGLLRLRHTPERLLALQRAVDTEPLPSIALYRQLLCPTLLIMATRGAFLREDVERIRTVNLAVQVEWLDCGHAVQTERPDELARLVVEFDASLDKGRIAP